MMVEQVLAPMLWGWLGAATLMVVLWLWQMRSGNAGIVDVGWAFAIGSLALYAALQSDAWGPRKILVGGVGVVWGYRLAWHLLRDRIWGRPEEGRYVTLRENWRAYVERAFFIFFQAQALLAILLALPFFLALRDTTPGWTVFDVAGLALWLIGVFGESLADRQLVKFKEDPANRGKTCRAGLWRYSRHPNYFFEWILWCGMATLALGTPAGWLAYLSPALILFFILRVTGIPPTEAQALKSRGEDYRRYQQETSAFFPWFPREAK